MFGVDSLFCAPMFHGGLCLVLIHCLALLCFMGVCIWFSGVCVCLFSWFVCNTVKPFLSDN